MLVNLSLADPAVKETQRVSALAAKRRPAGGIADGTAAAAGGWAPGPSAEARWLREAEAKARATEARKGASAEQKWLLDAEERVIDDDEAEQRRAPSPQTSNGHGNGNGNGNGSSALVQGGRPNGKQPSLAPKQFTSVPAAAAEAEAAVEAAALAPAAGGLYAAQLLAVEAAPAGTTFASSTSPREGTSLRRATSFDRSLKRARTGFSEMLSLNAMQCVGGRPRSPSRHIHLSRLQVEATSAPAPAAQRL